jgi:hypothetical protein
VDRRNGHQFLFVDKLGIVPPAPGFRKDHYVVVRQSSGIERKSITQSQSWEVGVPFGQTLVCEHILRALRALR